MNNKPRRGILPVVVLRDTVLFPGISQQLDMVRPLSITAIRRAVDNKQDVFITMQHSPEIDAPETGDIYTTGVIASVKQVIKHPSSGTIRIRVECLCRAVITSVTNTGEMFTGLVVEREEHPCEDAQREEALRRLLKETVKRYSQMTEIKQLRPVLEAFGSSRSLGALTDYLAHTLPVSGANKQELLTRLDHAERCELLVSQLDSELSIMELQHDIEQKVQESIDKNQREYYLREQLRVISDQLGDGDSPAVEADEYRQKIREMDLNEEVSSQLLKCCDKLAKLPFGSHEAAVERNYLDICLSIPWNNPSKERLDVEAASRKLDRDHYGLEKVKERILEFIAVRALAPDIKGQIICLVGPPGVGKTSIARSVADALGRKYGRISLGGVHDEADIRGHRKTYIGAMPGRIVNALRLAGTSNPLLLLDEVDKLASDFRGDPTSALLELLDPEQNCTFHDHYIDLPIDLSDVMFITTANDYGRIPAPLIDRMEVIEIPSYTHEEKLNIAKRHLVRKQLTRHGLSGRQLRFSDKALSMIIESYTREAGVRSLERELAAVCRKSAKRIATGEADHITVTDKNVREFLGPLKYIPEKTEEVLPVGTSNGLAVTSTGGSMLQIEVAVLEGTGKIELTGSLGDVMRESARTAISLVRFRARDWGIDPDFYKNKDIHIHAPEGAVPKDGPSAGITMTTALVSALTGIPVRGTVAMTGEITLRGRVLAIGGLREKSMAAMTAGADTVIMPQDNFAEVERLSDTVRRTINFIPASSIDTVLEHALTLPLSASGTASPAAESAAAETVPVVPFASTQIGDTHEAGESRI